MECRLKEIIKERGLKQGYIAEKAGISNTTMSALVTGRNLPTLPVAARIAKVLELHIDEIWILEEEKQKSP